MPIDVFEFLILIYFLSQINYISCYSNSFYQVLGRPNDPKNVTCIPNSHGTFTSTLSREAVPLQVIPLKSSVRDQIH